MNVALSPCSIPPFYNLQTGIQFLQEKDFYVPGEETTQRKMGGGQENEDGQLDGWTVGQLRWTVEVQSSVT